MYDPESIRLLHMVEAAEEALLFASGRRREDLGTDRLLLMGLLREIEVIGEAATKVSDATKAEIPGVPWR